VPWQILAAIGSIETDHGRSRAPGVHLGVNSFGCCAGPMQFNLGDGPPSTWGRYGIDGNRDGKTDVYDPADAIASAANYLRALLRDADGDLSRAVLGYNHSPEKRAVRRVAGERRVPSSRAARAPASHPEARVVRVSELLTAPRVGCPVSRR
jgi:Transglycosylase SLT domain